MANDSAARIELGRSFHQEGTFNVKVCESEIMDILQKVEMVPRDTLVLFAVKNGHIGN